MLTPDVGEEFAIKKFRKYAERVEIPLNPEGFEYCLKMGIYSMSAIEYIGFQYLMKQFQSLFEVPLNNI